MKIFYNYLIFFISLQSLAQNFSLTPLEKSVNTKKAPPEVRILKIDKEKKNYLSSNSRDLVLNKYLKKEITGWDEVDKDILYKSILNYSNKELKEKYNFLNDELITKVKNELK